jgi:WD40 repeat protein
LVSGSQDKTIKLWNLRTGQLLRTIKGHAGAVTSVALSPNGETLVSGSEDKTIKLWNVSTGKLSKTLAGHAGGVKSVVISRDGKILASSGDYEDNTIKLWNLATGKLMQSLPENSNAIAFSPDGKTLVTTSREEPENKIKFWRASP